MLLNYLMPHVNFLKVNHNDMEDHTLSKFLEVEYLNRNIFKCSLKIFNVVGPSHSLFTLSFFNLTTILGVNTIPTNWKDKKTKIEKFCGKIPKIKSW